MALLFYFFFGWEKWFYDTLLLDKHINLNAKLWHGSQKKKKKNLKTDILRNILRNFKRYFNVLFWLWKDILELSQRTKSDAATPRQFKGTA